jgi:hypothetical protein
MVGRIVKIGIAIGLAALFLGIYIGNRMPYGDTELRTVDAHAVLQDRATGLVLADETDGDKQFSFLVEKILWTSGSEHGEGNPPCLRTPRQEVDVQIGYTDVAAPDGTTYESIALWVGCA